MTEPAPEYNHTDEYAADQVKTDAAERSWRTFAQGFAIDVAVTLVLVMTTTFTSIEWTAAYWQAVGLLLAKTAIQAGVSNLARRLVPPAPQ